MDPDSSSPVVSVEISKIIRFGLVVLKKSFVEYELLVHRRDGVYSLWFRYSEMKKLDDVMRKRWRKDKTFPDFPGKGFLRNDTDPEFIEERRLDLEAYIQQVVSSYYEKDDDLQMFLGQAVFRGASIDKHDFVVPAPSPLPPVVLLGAEEIWLSSAAESCSDSLKLLFALKKKISSKDGNIEEQLALLEHYQSKVKTAVEMIEANQDVLVRILEAPNTPQTTKVYLGELVNASETAIKWTEVAEAQILSKLPFEAPASTGEEGLVVSAQSNDKLAMETPTGDLLNDSSSNNNDNSNNSNNPFDGPYVPQPLPQAKNVERKEENEKEEEEDFARTVPETFLNDKVVPFNDYVKRADHLIIRAFSPSESASELMKDKKKLLDELYKRREIEEAGTNRVKWNDLITNVEENVVVLKSISDAVGRLESQLYALVDRRASLTGKDVSETTALRRAIVTLRKVLRELKKEILSMTSDAATDAECNRVTDLQENAAQIQLDIEENFDYNQDLEDVVIDKIQQKLLKERAKEHEQAENEIFDL